MEVIRILLKMLVGALESCPFLRFEAKKNLLHIAFYIIRWQSKFHFFKSQITTLTGGNCASMEYPDISSRGNYHHYTGLD